ncbi:type II secretion system F family protein [Croceicoccus marinus]|jgi:tight adherence protein B|uniref:Type II secretion system F family protein n=1 Tax=Croceicoccus marinus TaxID=450378 RepID=A0A7G6VT34_9SPHN|nr:type II secretion system F family protein [Croceicoccus marinus]QNE04899.1 type II secretion system F family protein [Croceicoccus marinus]
MQLAQIFIVVIGMMLVLGIAFFALYGSGSSRQQAKRLQQIRYRHSQSAEARVEAQLKKAISARKPRVRHAAGSDSKIAALALRLHRTGKNWTVANYFYVSGGLALAVAVVILIKTGAPLLAMAGGAVLGMGLPHFIVGRQIKKRLAMFNARFPDGIDLLVRGLRSGLPVTETLAVVSTEIPGPVGEEFKAITDRVKVGKSLDDSLQETADRLDIPEFKFFCISLAIQRETGGNLAETLANLADVLRKRIQMRLKIRAMSSEAKASAYIVGALPFLVFTIVYILNPEYLGGFFVDERLMVAGMFGLCWISIGAFVMFKMVNFEI